MPFDVFISHSGKDIAAADAVRAKIEADGVRCWNASRDIPFGADWDQSVVAALKSCRVLVLIFSSHANNSAQVHEEVKLAYENGLAITPFRIEDEKPGRELDPYLAGATWVDALTPPVERHIEKIALQIKACIELMNEKGIVKPAPRAPIAVAAPAPGQRRTALEDEEPAGKPGKGGLIFVLALAVIVAAGAAWWFGFRKPGDARQGGAVAAVTPSPTPYKPPVATSQQTAALLPTPPPALPPTHRMLEATREHPFVNALGMRFIPVAGTRVLFSIWDTRVCDYRAYAMENPGVDPTWQNPGFNQDDDEPVVNVSWDDAKAFCAWLTQKDRKEGKIGLEEEYSLPTDAEWSAAAGAGKYPWGDQWPPPQGAGNYDPSLKADTYEHTSPAGSFDANALGLYDMGGNVWQWCEDYYLPSMNDKALVEKYSFLNDDGIYHVVRGASWISGQIPESLLSAYRYNGNPVNRDNRYGFRCVLGAAGSAR